MSTTFRIVENNYLKVVNCVTSLKLIKNWSIYNAIVAHIVFMFIVEISAENTIDWEPFGEYLSRLDNYNPQVRLLRFVLVL